MSARELMRQGGTGGSFGLPVVFRILEDAGSEEAASAT